jgi:hypothetical protein
MVASQISLENDGLINRWHWDNNKQTNDQLEEKLPLTPQNTKLPEKSIGRTVIKHKNGQRM